ncbi:MAG TPA: AAA family ATPase [Blastocatellia bacterium]|nr:AAA family ATPase [Blastocatellia bacterium]
MSKANNPTPPEKAEPEPRNVPNDLVALLSQKVVGQPAAMKFIVPYVYMYQAGLAPEGRPAGVFLLLGPTGTGKTKTVEAIAEVLHGSPKQVLKIDCGEFQMEHEVAKLIGSPPGYLGHRETPPMLTQQQLTAVTGKNCDLALVLFDEIEKAAPSLTRMLLGILDKATLRLGDNTTVDFEKSLIFFTSNLGAREMTKEMHPDIGFQAGMPRQRDDLAGKLESIALAAVRKRFSPEFVNRIDAVVTYQPLDAESLETILAQHIDELQKHVNTRLGARCFGLDISPESRQFLLRKGTSEEYGARELKRTLHRHLTQPLATMVATGQVEPESRVRVDLAADQESLVIRAVSGAAPALPQHPTILIVDDNRDLLLFLERLLAQAGWQLLTAGSAAQAREVFARQTPHSVLLDYMLGDDDGARLGLEFQMKSPQTQIILMTGGILSPEEEMILDERDIPVLRKPFLANDVLNMIRRRLSQRTGLAVGDTARR